MRAFACFACFACFAVICLLFPPVNAVDSDTQKQIDDLLKLAQTQSRRIDELESLLNVDAIRRAVVQEQTQDEHVYDQHVHNVNANERRLDVKKGDQKKCRPYYRKYADGAQAATPIFSEKVFSGNVKDTVVLKDLRVGQYDDFVLEADIWIEKPEGNFNTIITHHLKSHGTTCNQGSSWNVNVGYTLYIHSKGDIKFLMGTGQGTSRDVDLNGGKLKPKTWTKLKVTFLKGVATLYVDCAPKGSAKFVIGERQISATVPTKIGQYGCDNLKSVFKGKMRFVSIYKPTAPLYFPSAEDYSKNKGVIVLSDDSVVSLGVKSDIALVRTGPGRAAFIGDISFSGGVVAKMAKEIRALKGQVAALQRENTPTWMHGGGAFKISDYAKSKLQLFKSWGGESKFAARGVAVDGDGNVIVVGNGAQSGVKKYLVASNQWTTVSKGGNNLWGLALCPNGNIYYVARGLYMIMAVDCKSRNSGDGTCSSYGSAYSFKKMQPEQPYFVACNVDNDLAVAEVYNKAGKGNGLVHHYDAQTKKWSDKVGHDAQYALGISFAPSGDIYYITDHASKKLNEIRRIQCMDGRPMGAGQSCSKYKEVVKPVSKIGDSHGWGNLVVTGDGTILYNEKTGHYIGYYKEGMKSPQQVPHNKNGGSISHPWGMAVAPNSGDIYVSDYGQGKLWVIRKS